MGASNIKNFPLVLAAAFAACSIAACEKQEPIVVPKVAKGKDTTVHFDTMQDQPKYIKVKKKDANSKEAIALRREMRDKAKGKLKRLEPWEY